MAAVKAGMLPVPLVAPRPIDSLLRDQLYTAPGVLPLNTTEGTATPTQYTWFGTLLTVGTGFTVIVNVIEAPVHTAPVVAEVTGVTVIVAVTGAVPLLTATNEAISPEPEAARPIELLVFVQL